MMEPIKIFALVVATALLLSLILVAAGVISWRLFWAAAILAAFIAYFVIPKLKSPQSL